MESARRDFSLAESRNGDGSEEDEPNVHSVRAVDLATGSYVHICYRVERECGFGSFGEVCQVRTLDIENDEGREGGGPRVRGGRVFALKRAHQDRRFKNRELSLMRSHALRHPNIVRCDYAWQERDAPEDPNQITLHLLLEYVPTTLYTHYRSWTQKRARFPEFLSKLYLFQLLRALAWCHALGVCHRDIKPHNILIAKVLKAGDKNVVYTCSRYYRAPELIFDNPCYDHAEASTDLWSVGCVFGELLLGKVLFPGANGIDQLVEIIKVLGAPNRAEVFSMNPDYDPTGLPVVTAQPLTKVLVDASPESISLLRGFLRYAPRTRLTASEALAHAFFDELKRDVDLCLPDGTRVDPRLLFSFSREELSIRPNLNRRIVPRHWWPTLAHETGIDLASDAPFEPVSFATLRQELRHA
ncbi:hypothetical protein JCM11491_003863 [Sporobolomyces phaffii]